jgi:hypothetical protein
MDFVESLVVVFEGLQKCDVVVRFHQNEFIENVKVMELKASYRDLRFIPPTYIILKSLKMNEHGHPAVDHNGKNYGKLSKD